MTHETTQDVMTVKQAAAALGLATESVYRAIWNRRLTAKKSGRELFISASDIERYRMDRAARLQAQLEKLQATAAV